MVRLVLLLSISFFMTAAFAHNDHGSNEQSLGTLSFPTSGKKEVQDKFIQSVLLLHNFEYDEARQRFEEIVKADPDFAMAYWGIAMTYNHPLWEEQDLDAGRLVLEKLSTTEEGRIEKAKTAKEKGFIRAINFLYGKGNKLQRDINYANAMQELYRHYPADDEIAVFYSLALLGSTEGARNYLTYMQAAAIAEEVISHNPTHPGATHYAIHSYDDLTHAPLGLRAARSYAKMAAGSSHALHMPSHIFLALGMWDDVINSNRAAWDASIKHNPESNPSHYMVHDLHALQWLSYAYLQKKEFKQSYQLVKLMEKIAQASNTSMAKWYYAMMRGAYINETLDWTTDLQPVDMTGIELSARSSDMYTNVMVALHTINDSAALKKKIHVLEKLYGTTPSNVPKSEEYVDQYASIKLSGITSAKIAELEWRAQIKLHEKKTKDALQILKAASILEDKRGLSYGPPVPVKPVHELIGDILLGTKHDDVLAFHEYTLSLERAPNRTRSNDGRELAREKIKQPALTNTKEMNSYFNKLMINPEH